jgi:hypothetical protein
MARVKPAEMGEELNDIWRLVVGYTKQETTAPLRGIGRFAGYGFGGMVCFALATGFGVLAILRGLQAETWLDEHYWSVVPYALAMLWCLIVGVVAYRSVNKTPWKKQEGDAK